MNRAIPPVLTDHGVVKVADHPRLRSTLSRLVDSGVLARPLPGTYAAPLRTEAEWLRTVCAWAEPQGVLHGETAASLWLPGFCGRETHLAHRSLRSRRRIRVCRKQIPPEFVRVSEGIRFASPAYAAVELAASDDGRAICEALRRGLATSVELAAACASMAGSRGHSARRRVVQDCLVNPWSYAELRLQRILRAADISGWRGNATITLDGEVLHPDILFRRNRVIVEFDGREVHNDPANFLKDRERQNVFVEHGYLVLRFGWEHLDDPEYVVRAVRRALRATRVAE
jgi:very-short-patch-repair endonuclease